MTELGLSLVRLPDTFYMDLPATTINNLPHIAASPEVVQFVQCALVLGALPISIGLTQKLGNDNRIGGICFGVHSLIQTSIAAALVYQFFLSNPLQLV